MIMILALTLADWPDLADHVDLTVFEPPFASTGRRDRAGGLRDHPRHARAHGVSADADRGAAEAKAADHLRHAQCRDRPGGGERHASSSAAQPCARDPTAPLDHGPDPGTDPQYRPRERAHACRRAVADHLGIEIEGKTLGVIGLGKLGTKVSRLAGVRHERDRLEPEPDAGECTEAAGVTCVSKEELFATADVVTIHLVLGPRSRGLVGRRICAHETHGLSRQHRARADHRRGGAAGSVAAEEIAGAGIDVFSVEPLPVDHPSAGSTTS